MSTNTEAVGAATSPKKFVRSSASTASSGLRLGDAPAEPTQHTSTDINTTNSSPNPKSLNRRRLLLRLALIFTVVIEQTLLGLLRWVGWNSLGIAVQLTIACVVIFLPVAVVLGVLVRNRFRFGMRSLFVFVICAAGFFLMSALPYAKYRAERNGVLHFQQAGIFMDQAWMWQQLEQSELLEVTHDYDFSPSTQVPFWLTPFTAELSRVSTDRSVKSINLESEQQAIIYIRYHKSFTSLREIGFNANFSAGTWERLKKSLADHPSIRSLWCNHTGVVPSQFWDIVRKYEVPGIQITTENPSSTVRMLPNDFPNRAFVKALWIWQKGGRISADDEDLICSSKSLRVLCLPEAPAALLERMKQTMQDCEIKGL